MNPGAKLRPAIEAGQALMDLPEDLGGSHVDIGAPQPERLAKPQDLRLPLRNERRKRRWLAAL